MSDHPELSDEVRSWLESEAQDRDFLKRTHPLVPNAIAVKNHRFFLTRAECWLHLVQLQWQLGRPSPEVVSSLQHHLKESLQALELFSPCPPAFIYRLFSVAVTLGDLRTAHFLASLPDTVWGLPVAGVDHRTLIEAWVSFAVLRGNDTLARRLLAIHHDLCFEVKAPAIVTHDIQRGRLVHPLLHALIEKNERDFASSLLALAEWDNTHLNLRRSDSAVNAAVCALAFARLAQWRVMTVVVGHPGIPVAWIDPLSDDHQRGDQFSSPARR